MRKNSFLVIIAAVTLMLFSTSFVSADGGLFGKNGRDIYEPEQKAVIFFHNGMEELVLSVSFDGAAQEFAWLVPTPNIPEIEESEANLFELMSALTPSNLGEVTGGMEYNQHLLTSVDVLKTALVGPYDITVIQAGSASELRSWLEGRGLAFDQQAESVLQEYIESGWCFTAMRINPYSMETAGYQLSDGTIEPLRFTFKAECPLFPLRISSLNPGDTEVLVYVLGDKAYVSDGMQLENAETWEAAQIGALKGYSVLASELEQDGGCELTKLRRTFNPTEMEDIYFKPKAGEPVTAKAGSTPASGGSSDASGDAFPWWVLLASSLILSAIVAGLYGPGDSGSKTGLKKKGVVFLVAAAAFFVALLPVGILMYDAGQGVGAGCEAAAVWPWSADILMSRNGWSELVRPDGRSEILGLEEELARLVSFKEVGSEEPTDFEHYTGQELEWDGGELEGEGGWRWSVTQTRDDWSQSFKLKVYNAEGLHETGLDSPYIHAVRLSPEGDRLWVVLNPGVPVNTTEAREYSFPSLDLERSLIHDDCLREGKIVLSTGGEPLLAGCFSSGEDDMNIRFGLVSLLEGDSSYVGKYLEIKPAEMNNPDVAGPSIGLMNGGFCDATDWSPYLLLSGYGFQSGTSMIYVLDTGDGEIFEVAEGRPKGWGD